MTTAANTEVLDRLKERLQADARPIAELILAAHQQEIPDLPNDAELQAALRDAVLADVEDVLTGFRFDPPLPRALTYEGSQLARVAAHTRLPLPTLLHGVPTCLLPRKAEASKRPSSLANVVVPRSVARRDISGRRFGFRATSERRLPRGRR